MKTVIATIKPFQLDQVKDALLELGHRDLKVIECKAYAGRHTEIYRGAEYAVDYLPKVDVIVIVHESEVDRVVGAISQSAKTGREGDGWIAVNPTEQLWDIGTGRDETGLAQGAATA